MRHPIIRPRALVRWMAWAARPVPLTWLLALGGVWLLLSAGDVLSTTLILRCGITCGHEDNSLAELLWVLVIVDAAVAVSVANNTLFLLTR